MVQEFVLPSHLPTATQTHLAQNTSAMHSKTQQIWCACKQETRGLCFSLQLCKTCCWSYRADQGLKTLRVSFFVCSILMFLQCFLTAIAIFRQPNEKSSCYLVTAGHSSFNSGKHQWANAQQSKSYRWLQHFIEVGWWGCICAHAMRVMPEKGCTDYWCIADKM